MELEPIISCLGWSLVLGTGTGLSCRWDSSEPSYRKRRTSNARERELNKGHNTYHTFQGPWEALNGLDIKNKILSSYFTSWWSSLHFPVPLFPNTQGPKGPVLLTTLQCSYSLFALLNKCLECSNVQPVFIKLSLWYSACSDPMIWTQVSDYEVVLRPLPYTAKVLFQTHPILKDSWYLLQKPLVP